MVKRGPVSRLQGNVWALRDPMFPLYVIRGKRRVLVDCSILAKAQDIEEKLGSLLGGEKIELVLLTHSHYDHTGACSILQEKHGFEIIASSRTKEILESDKAVAFIDDLNQKFKEILDDRSDTVFTKPARMHGIKEGDFVDLGDGQTVEVFETPGHTRCSVSYLLRPENILFPGDAAGVVEKNGKIKPLFLSSYSQYERSLVKLRSIGAETLALPHNRAITGAQRTRDFLSDSLAETRKLKEEIIARLRRTVDFDRIAEELLEQEYFSPTIMGPREALLINVKAMVKGIFHEFVKEV